MPGGPWSGCGFKLADAASYFPCAGWLWAEGEAEESQHILHPPTQNLAEALIPPTQPDVSLRGEDGEESSHGGQEQRSNTWDQGSQEPISPEARARSPGQATSKPKRLNAVRQSTRPTESEGIELKTTEANLLLGQEHLHSGGKFVAAQPGRKQTVRANGTTSVGA